MFKEFPNYTENTFKSSVQYLFKYLKKIIEINYEISLKAALSSSFLINETDLNQIDELFEKYLLNNIDLEYENSIDLLINESLNFIDIIMDYEYVESIQHILVFPFINIVSNLIFPGKQQETLINDDPNLFVVNERDHDDETTTIRAKTIKSIEKIIDIETCQQAAIKSIIAISEFMFCNRSDQPLKLIFQELQQPNNLMKIMHILDGFDQNSYNEFLYSSSLSKEKELPEWKGKEVSLFLLGSFQSKITKFYEQNGGCTFQVIGNLIQEFSVKYNENLNNQLLMCRYYQCFSSFSNQICMNQNHVDIIQKSLIFSFTNENSQAFRIIALDCLGSICSALKEKQNQFLVFEDNNAKTIVQNIIQVINKSSKDILPQILSNLASIFTSISNIAIFFTESGVNIITNLISHFEGEAEIQKKVIELIQVLAHQQQSYAILYHAFQEQIVQCFQILNNFVQSHDEFIKIKQQEINIIQNRIQILKVLIKFKPSDIAIFSDYSSIVLKLLYVNDDISLQQETTLCLKQIIFSQPQSLSEHKNDLSLLILKLVENIQNQPEAFSQYLPNLVLVSFNNLLELDRNITEKIIEKLQECESYFLIITFLIFFTRLIEKSPKETLQFLIELRLPSGQSGFEIIFKKLKENFWYIKEDAIKNQLYIPLAKLLTFEEATLSQYKFGEPQLECGFQIFCFLSRALEIELFPDQFENQNENDQLQSHQEFQLQLIEDIYRLQNSRLLRSTKVNINKLNKQYQYSIYNILLYQQQILTEFFQTMYSNQNQKAIFEKFINQMEFDEKMAIENVINQLQNVIISN